MPTPTVLSTKPAQHHAFRKLRCLLALDGARLTPEVLTAALKQCVQLTDQLDILLVNPPQAPTYMLGGLLLRLEHSGIDYRLVSREGNIGEEMIKYLHRHTSITLIIIDSLPALEQTMATNLHELRRNGYRFVSLLEDNLD